MFYYGTELQMRTYAHVYCQDIQGAVGPSSVQRGSQSFFVWVQDQADMVKTRVYCICCHFICVFIVNLEILRSVMIYLVFCFV